MAQLCGLAPSTAPGGRPLVAAMHQSPGGAPVPASPDWAVAVGSDSQVFRSSQACLKDTPAVLETIKALASEHGFVVLTVVLLEPSPPSFETRFLHSCPTHLVTRMALNF